jgi:exopolysaccharide production protein ExoZ
VDEAQSRHVLGLDIIRFAAAMMVMTYHYDHDVDKIPYSGSGWVGVEVFFVLSGFVISHSADGAAPIAFLRNRIVRLMPGVWICSTVTALIDIWADTNIGLRAYMATIVLLPVGPWVDSSYWTLPVEVMFYALVLLSLYSWNRFSLPLLLEGMVIASGAYWFPRCLLGIYPHVLGLQFIEHIPDPVVKFAMLTYGCHFALGGLMWLCLRRGITYWRIALIFLCLAAASGQIVVTASHTSPQGEKFISLLIWVACVGAILASVLGNRIAWGLFGNYAKVIRLIGLATYPLYLLHDNIGRMMINSTTMPSWLIMGIMICLSCLVADLVEPRLQRWLRARLKTG